MRESFFQNIGRAFGLEPFREVAVDHAFICHSFIGQSFTKVYIERIHEVPYFEEALFHVRFFRIQVHGQFAAFPEVIHEFKYRIQLFFSEIRIGILQILEVRHVGEEFVRFSEIFVGIVEVAEYDVAPKDEFVERFGVPVQ